MRKRLSNNLTLFLVLLAMMPLFLQHPLLAAAEETAAEEAETEKDDGGRRYRLFRLFSS